VVVVLPYLYVFTFLFTNEKTASVSIQLFLIIFGVIAGFVIGIMKTIFMFEMESNVFLGLSIADFILRIIPIYNTVSTLATAAINTIMLVPKLNDPLSFHYLGQWLLMTFIDLILYWLLVWLIETMIEKKKINSVGEIPSEPPSSVKDDDVIAEEQKVQEILPMNTAVRVCRARKTYDNIWAVNNTSFKVDQGEVFALLGVNGAGKTTMFKMITLQVSPTCGSFHINGINMCSRENKEARKYLGYCTQDNVIFEALSVREHLKFYANVKGIPERLHEEVISNVGSFMNFGDNISKQAWKLSGGNKRKLCTAIALIGHPAVLLLDEPTTGLDPKSRRDVWDVIRAEIEGPKKCAVILTTHSMEEVEALATKAAIMVKGNLRCYGSLQHLKHKYGNSYNVEVKIAVPSADLIKEKLVELQFNELSAIISLDQLMRVLESLNVKDAGDLVRKRDAKVGFLVDKVFLNN
jgi:ABC-type multidrug transport system ATPase subunit